MLWCISVNVQGGMYISNVNQTLVFISGGVHFVYVSDGVFCVYNESSIELCSIVSGMSKGNHSLF